MLPRKIADLDIDRLQEVLDYDPETGILTWRIRTGPMCKFDVPAGHVRRSSGYRVIRIDGKEYYAHQLAWLHFYGVPPEGDLDHRNTKRADNGIGNLREATRTQNACNRNRSSTNTTGFKGVARFNNRYTRAKYRSSIRLNGKRIFLGLFHTPEAAYEAYCKKARELHGEFHRV